MPIRGPLIGPALRSRIGASVLSAARGADTRFVKKRLARFAREHRRYVAAQRNVIALERRLRAARARLSRCDEVQDEAVEALARALVGDGHRRRNPFAAFGAPSPSKLARLPFADEAEAVHQLVRAIQRDTRISERTSHAARAVDKAAHAVEQAIIQVKQVEATVSGARRSRDAMGRGWHSAYMALKNGARAAADDGAPELHAILFAAPSRVPSKGKKRRLAKPTLPENAATDPDSPVPA